MSICDREVRQREALGAALGRPARRLGAQRGPAAPTYEAALERTGARAGLARARRRLRRRRVPAPGRRARRRAVRHRRLRGTDRRSHATRLPTRTCASARWRTSPGSDDTFDLVTGFNSFFFANDIVAALREAGRVAKPGAPVVIQVWGAHERCELEAMKQIARPFLPPRPPDAPPTPTCRSPGALRRSRRRPD